MAQRVSHVLVSDLTDEEMGDDEGQTVEFGLDGVDFEIDLFNDQADELRNVLAQYVAAARRTGGRAKRGTARKSGGSAATDRAQNQAIRTWAGQNGYELADRGRIPQHVVDAYHEKAGRNGLAAAS